MEFNENEKKEIESIINILESIKEHATYCLEDIQEEYYPNSTKQDKFDILSIIKYRCDEDLIKSAQNIKDKINNLYDILEIK
jgi:hypothetical protein